MADAGNITKIMQEIGQAAKAAAQALLNASSEKKKHGFKGSGKSFTRPS